MTSTVVNKDLICVSARELSDLLDISERHVWRMNAERKLPKPIRIGRCTRWGMKQIKQWLVWGCPSRRQFEANQRNAGKR